MIITFQKIIVNVVLFCDIKDSPNAGFSSPSGYDPHLLDDPELTSGRHRKVLNLASYLVSTCDTHRNYLLSRFFSKLNIHCNFIVELLARASCARGRSPIANVIYPSQKIW